MSDLIQTAMASLLAPEHLTAQQLESTLGRAMGKQIDYADLYLQSTHAEHWHLEDGIVKEGAFSIDRGFGLRVVSGEKTGFAYADQLDLKALQQAADAAKSITHVGSGQAVHVAKQTHVTQRYPDLNPLASWREREKVDLLLRLDRYARAQDPRITHVIISLAAEYDVVMIMQTEGDMVADVRPLVRLNVQVVAEQGDRRETGYAGGGGRAGYDYFSAENIAEAFVDKAVRQALTNLESVPMYAGMMPVVLGPGWPAVLLHEAVGHGLEGDFNRKGSSAFSGRIGQKVASELCTVVDDGTLSGRRGSLTVDDEGVPSQCTVLIENGILKQYMQDKHNARLMGAASTGNGRRESYSHLPIPRMTNTYLRPGAHDPNEIIASVECGLYAVDFAGGQVDITSGKFVFSTSEAYLIEQGKITRPVKGATLVGNGPEVMHHISMVGNDFALDSGIGVCGKDGQSVPVGVGQPTLKIEQMTVGGSQTELD